MTTKVHRTYHKVLHCSWSGLSALAGLGYIVLYGSFLKVQIGARQAVANGLGDQE